jgi:hypothetical protein
MICQECGLPIKACNAIASFREAVKQFKLGRTAEAERNAEFAEECFGWWMQELREKDNA